MQKEEAVITFLQSVTEQCAKDLGFENNQFVVIAHSDTKHGHIHIVANRIGFDKRTVSDSNSYKKIANYCRKMEVKYDLKQVLNLKRFLSKEQRNIPKFDQRKENLKELIRLSLSKSNQMIFMNLNSK